MAKTHLSFTADALKGTDRSCISVREVQSGADSSSALGK
jgi:hypothetical protein